MRIFALFFKFDNAPNLKVLSIESALKKTIMKRKKCDLIQQ
jgi:hypothetical protein